MSDRGLLSLSVAEIIRLPDLSPLPADIFASPSMTANRIAAAAVQRRSVICSPPANEPKSPSRHGVGSIGHLTLVGRTVAPAFEFPKFEMVPKDFARE